MSYKAVINFDFASLYPTTQKDFSKSVKNILRKYKIKKIITNHELQKR